MKKKQGVKITKGILWNFNWRIRSEIFYRKDSKTKGGHFNVQDEVTKMNDETLAGLDALITDFRLEEYGEADT